MVRRARPSRSHRVTRTTSRRPVHPVSRCLDRSRGSQCAMFSLSHASTKDAAVGGFPGTPWNAPGSLAVVHDVLPTAAIVTVRTTWWARGVAVDDPDHRAGANCQRRGTTGPVGPADAAIACHEQRPAPRKRSQPVRWRADVRHARPELAAVGIVAIGHLERQGRRARPTRAAIGAAQQGAAGRTMRLAEAVGAAQRSALRPTCDERDVRGKENGQLCRVGRDSCQQQLGGCRTCRDDPRRRDRHK